MNEHSGNAFSEAEIAYFWSKVQKKPTTDCWLWTGAYDKDGYGRHQAKNQKYLAHRLAFELANPGAHMPEVVEHACDVRPCCNPAHLRAGTQASNMADREAKNRHRHRPKLTPDIVLQIKRKHAEGLPNTRLAELFNVDESTIRNINTGKTWKQVKLERESA